MATDSCAVRRFLRLAIMAGAAVLAVAAPTRLRAELWDGGGASNDWSTNENWNPDGAPSPSAFADIILAGSVQLDPSVDQGWNVGSLMFAPNAGSFTLGGAQLTIGSGGITNVSTHIQTINNGIVLNAGQTWDLVINGLTLNGDVDIQDHTLTIDGGATFADNLSGTGALVHSGGTLTLSGTTANTFTGDVTTSGTLLLGQGGLGGGALQGNLYISGTVQLLASGQIATTVGKKVSVLEGGLFDLNGFNEYIPGLELTGGTVETNGGSLSVIGDVTSQASSTTARITGQFDLAFGIGSVDVADGAAAEDLVIENILFHGGITKSGDGTLVLRGSRQNLPGTTRVNGGVLVLDQASTFSVFQGLLTIGDGAGIDAVRWLRNEQITIDTPGIVINSSGIADLNGQIEHLPILTFNGGTLTTGSGLAIVEHTTTATASANTATISGRLQLGDTVAGATRTFHVEEGSALIDLEIDAAILEGAQASSTGFIKTGAGTLRFSGSDDNTYTGATDARAGVLILNKSPGAYDHGLDLETNNRAILGDLAIGNGADAPGTAVVRLADDEQIASTLGNTVTIHRSGRLEIAAQDETIGDLTLIGGQVSATTGTLRMLGTLSTQSSDIPATITGGTLLIVGTTFVSVVDGPAAIDLEISAALADDGESTHFSMFQLGTLRMSGASANTFMGHTTVRGVLELNKEVFDGAVPGSMSVLTDSTVRWLRDHQVANGAGQSIIVSPNGSLDLNHHSDTIGRLTLLGGQVSTGAGVLTTEDDTLSTGSSLTTAVISGNLHFNSATTTVTVSDGPADDDLDISAAISGGEIRKQGLGRLVLSGSGANTFSGSLFVDEGSVILRKSASDGAVPTDLVLGAGTLVRLEQIGQIANTASVSVGSAATFDLNGFNEVLGDLDVTGGSVLTGVGTLTLQGTLSSDLMGGDLTGSLSLGGGVRQFNIDSAAATPLIIDAAISSGGITKDGSGDLRLIGAAANTLTSATTVNSGTMLLGKSVADGAIAGNLIIGDGIGSDTVRLLANEQIAATPGNEVTVNSSGTFDLNGFSETISRLRLTGSSVQVGAGMLTVNQQVAADASATGAGVIGALNLGGAVTFSVADGAAGDDLTLAGAIGEAVAAGGLIKTGVGQLRLSGAANTYTGLTNVNQGTLVLAKSAGVAAIPGDLVLGGSSTLRLESNEQIDHSPGRVISLNHPALLDLNGFNETLRGVTLIGGHIQTGAGTLTVLGPLVTLPSNAMGTISGNVSLDGVVATLDVPDGGAAVDLEISAIVANGGVNKTGAGTLRLNAANTYAGGTTVAGGTLLVQNSTGSATGSGAVLVQSGGRVGGAGSIAGPVTVEMGGSLVPGASAGALSIDSVVFQPGAAFEVEVGGATPGTLHDVLAVANSAALDGAFGVRMINSFADTILHEDTFTVLTAGTLSGAFANAANGTRLNNADASGSFIVNYGETSAFGPNDVVLSNFLRPPETATWVGASGLWTDASRWDINKVPRNQGTENYEARIGGNITATLNEDITVNSLTLGTSGSPTLTGTGDLTVATLNWQRGVLAGMAGEGDVIATGGGTIGTSVGLTLARRLINQGTMTWAGVNIGGDATGVVENTAGATLILTPGGSTTGAGSSGPSILNNGALQMTGATASDTFIHNRALTGTGAIEVLGGTLDLRGAGTVLSGTVDVAAGAVLKLSAGSSPFVSVTTDITGDGMVVLENGTTTFDNPGGSSVNNLVMNAQGHLGGSGPLSVNNLTWVSSGSMIGTGATTVTGTATFVNPSNPLSRQFFIEGTLDWQNGLLFGNGTLQIESSAQANLLGQGGTTTGTTTTNVVNHGTMILDNSDPGVEPTYDFNDPLTNAGLIQIMEGAFILRGTNSSNSGDVEIDGGRLELRANGFTSPGTITGAGEVLFAISGTSSITGVYDVATTNVSLGTHTFSSAATPAVTDTLNLTGGTIAGNPGIAADAFTWSTGGAISGRVTVTGAATMNIAGSHGLSGLLINQGTLDWLQGNIGGGGAGTLRNEAGAQLNIVGAANRSSTSPTGASFVNEGNIAKKDAAVVTLGMPFNNTGSVVVEGGTLSLGNVVQHVTTTLTGGTWEIRDGATLTFSAGSNLVVNQGTVILRGPTSVFAKIDSFSNNQGRFEIHDGRNFTRTGTFNNSGQVVIDAGSTLTTTVNYLQSTAGSEIQVDGTLALGGAGSTISGGSILSGNGQVTGPIFISAGGIVSPGASAGTLTVGNFTLDGGVYEWELDAADQSDTVLVTGTLAFGSAATLRLIDSGGTLDPLTEYVLFSYAPTASDPANPAWTFDASQAPFWDLTGASVMVDAANDRVVLTGLSAFPFLAGDFDEDHDVDGDDLAIWRSGFGLGGSATHMHGDADGDLDVDGGDFLTWQQQLGSGPAVVPTADAVPEPATFVLLIVAAAGWCQRRRRTA